jgi:hypothetical protein
MEKMMQPSEVSRKGTFCIHCKSRQGHYIINGTKVAKKTFSICDEYFRKYGLRDPQAFKKWTEKINAEVSNNYSKTNREIELTLK